MCVRGGGTNMPSLSGRPLVRRHIGRRIKYPIPISMSPNSVNDGEQFSSSHCDFAVPGGSLHIEAQAEFAGHQFMHDEVDGLVRRVASLISV